MNTFRELYKIRSKGLATKPKGETLTDQSQRNDCDLNVIVKKHMPGTVVAGGNKQPIYGADLSDIPTDLAGAIHTLRNMENLRGQLPTEFRELAVADLLELTPQQINEIIAKAQPAPQTKKEDDK